MRIERAVRPHRAIRNQRQDDQRRTRQDQDVIEFLFGEYRADKAVKPGARGEQNRHDDGKAARQRRLLR